jgi:hypothetical protein
MIDRILLDSEWICLDSLRICLDIVWNCFYISWTVSTVYRFVSTVSRFVLLLTCSRFSDHLSQYCYILSRHMLDCWDSARVVLDNELIFVNMLWIVSAMCRFVFICLKNILDWLESLLFCLDCLWSCLDSLLIYLGIWWIASTACRFLSTV